jgi:hypothetical protein
MRTFAQKTITFTQRLTNESEIAIFQIAKASVDDACRARRGSGGEVALFEQQNALASAGQLPCNGNSIDPAADHSHVKVFALERRSRNGTSNSHSAS